MKVLYLWLGLHLFVFEGSIWGINEECTKKVSLFLFYLPIDWVSNVFFKLVVLNNSLASLTKVIAV